MSAETGPLGKRSRSDEATGAQSGERKEPASRNLNKKVCTSVPKVSILSDEPDPNADKDRKGLDQKRQLIVVLVQAGLQSVKSRTGYELACADTHRGILKKNKLATQQFRPDIVHRSLLALMDSPLNRAGHLKVYVQTTRNVLIEVSPQVRLPRTYKRFAGLMVQLLHKMKIRASNGPSVLLKTVKNPVTAHLPPNCLKIGTSVQGKLVNLDDYVAKLPANEPICFVVGAHAHGPADVDYTDQSVAISRYGLSSSVVVNRIASAFEKKWGVL